MRAELKDEVVHGVLPEMRLKGAMKRYAETVVKLGKDPAGTREVYVFDKLGNASGPFFDSMPMTSPRGRYMPIQTTNP